MTHYVYLLQEREFITTQQAVYKIGKTVRPINQRMREYPKDSNLILCMSVSDCTNCELALLEQFKIQFKQRNDIGREYFEGELKEIRRVFFGIASGDATIYVPPPSAAVSEETTKMPSIYPKVEFDGDDDEKITAVINMFQKCECTKNN